MNDTGCRGLERMLGSRIADAAIAAREPCGCSWSRTGTRRFGWVRQLREALRLGGELGAEADPLVGLGEGGDQRGAGARFRRDSETAIGKGGGLAGGGNRADIDRSVRRARVGPGSHRQVEDRVPVEEADRSQDEAA